MKAPLLAPFARLPANRCPDISQWNGLIVPDVARLAGVEEVIVRFGEGYAADPLAILHWRLLAGVGIRLSAYWSIVPTRDANRQAGYFKAMIQAAAPMQVPRRAWIDCQLAPSIIPRQPAVPIAVMLAVMQIDFPGIVGVYTRKDWWEYHVGRSPAWASKYHLWIADWSELRSAPRIPAAWAGVGAELWQIGSQPAAWAPQCAAVDTNIILKEE